MKLPAESLLIGKLDDRRQHPDRRASPRRRLLKSGRTFWPNGDSSECTVINLSGTGAQLEIRGPTPNAFDLTIEGDRLRRSCCVVWRKANRIGVRFHEQSQLTQANPATNLFMECRRYAEKCQELAERATPSEREILLGMAEMWIKVLRRLRRKARE